MLFVDEVYQLKPKSNPLGGSILDYLLTEMEDRRGQGPPQIAQAVLQIRLHALVSCHLPDVLMSFCRALGAGSWR